MTTQNNLENINFMSLSAYNQLSTHETDELYFVPTPESSTTQKGIVQLCTASETSALSSDSKAVTPASLSTLMATKASVSSVSSAISTHNTNSSAHTTLFAGKVNNVTEYTDSSSTTKTIATLNGNENYYLGTLTALTVTAVTDSPLESLIDFHADASGCTLSLPSSLKAIGSVPAIEGGEHYLISIFKSMYLIAIVND